MAHHKYLLYVCMYVCILPLNFLGTNKSSPGAPIQTLYLSMQGSQGERGGQLNACYTLSSLSSLLALYSDCLRRESNFLASMRQVTALCVRILLHCMRVRLRNGYTQAYAQILQHTHMHKAVTGRVEAKKLLFRRRQSNYSICLLTRDFHTCLYHGEGEVPRERFVHVLPCPVKLSSICLMTRHFYLCLYHGKGEVPGERFKHILPCQVCPAFC